MQQMVLFNGLSIWLISGCQEIDPWPSWRFLRVYEMSIKQEKSTEV
jgi:hypothetical protein